MWCQRSNTTVLEKTYRDKAKKYEGFREEYQRTFNRQCRLTIVIVSSLGAVLKRSQDELNTLMKYKKKSKKDTKMIARRISTAAVIGSYLTFYNTIQRKKPTLNIHNNLPLIIDATNIQNAIGNVEMEEPDLPEHLDT